MAVGMQEPAIPIANFAKQRTRGSGGQQTSLPDSQLPNCHLFKDRQL
jgi:hypothetical protein